MGSRALDASCEPEIRRAWATAGLELRLDAAGLDGRDRGLGFVMGPTSRGHARRPTRLAPRGVPARDAHLRAMGHIVLVGLMGSGKTTVGAALAAALGVPLRDSDADIERDTGPDAAATSPRATASTRSTPWRPAISSMRSRRPGTTVICRRGQHPRRPGVPRRPARPAPSRRVARRPIPTVLAARLQPDDHRPGSRAGPGRGHPASRPTAARPAFASVADLTLDADAAARDARRGDPRAHRRRPLASPRVPAPPPHPRCRHRHRRQPRAAVRRRLARRRPRRRRPASRATSTPSRSGSTPGPCWSSPAGPTSRSRWVARSRSSGRSRRRPRRTGRRASAMPSCRRPAAR